MVRVLENENGEMLSMRDNNEGYGEKWRVSKHEKER